MENLKKRCKVELLINERQLVNLVASPMSISSKIFHEKLVTVHKTKTVLSLNRPSYVGMCIVGLSKTLMYNFHYSYVKQRYNEKAVLLFTGTDSLGYKIDAGDVYRDFYVDKDKFDNSDYPSNHVYYFYNNSWEDEG